MQTAEREGESDRLPESEAAEAEVFKGRWQKAIEAEMKDADSGQRLRQWHDRNIAVTTWTFFGQTEGPRRGHIGLALSEDGAQVILTICQHQGNHLDSDMEMDLEAILSIPEAEALAMALLARRPGHLSSDYANGVSAQCLEVPTPIV
jgi:hypothetical protein